MSSERTEPESTLVQPAQAQGQYSPDGHWWWNGAQWVAVDGVAAPPAVRTAAPARSQRHVRKSGWRTRRLVGLIVVFSLLVALSFYGAPTPSVRVVAVDFFGLAALSATIIFLAVMLVRFIRGLRSKVWAGVVIAVLVLQAAVATSLNVYADSTLAPNIALIQNYYADTAAAVTEGNQVLAGTAPSGVTFDTVYLKSQDAAVGLANLSVPASLASYRKAVALWALAVDEHAQSAKDKTSTWQNVSYQPDPFQLALTDSEAEAAFAAGLSRVSTLMAFGNRAIATKDPIAMRAVGNGLDAQEYWLQEIYTSDNATGLAAFLHFVEPLNLSTPNGTAKVVSRDFELVASHLPSRAFKPRSPDGCHSRSIGCFPKLQRPLYDLWSTIINLPPTTSATTASTWPGDEQQLAQIGLTADAKSLSGPGSGTPSALTPPSWFVAKCQSSKGITGEGVTIYDRTASRVPTSEAGWTCLSQGRKCFDLLTLSGSRFMGTQGGKSSNCPELGLVPPQYGPLNQFYGWLGSSASYSPSLPTPSSAPAPKASTAPICPAGYPYYNSADGKCYQEPPGTTRCPAGYPYYNSADGKCYQEPPGTVHCPATYPYYNSADGKCYQQPVGSGTWYIHYSCGGVAECAYLMGGATGVKASFPSQSACQNLRNTGAGNGTIQLSNTWCSQSSNPRDTGP